MRMKSPLVMLLVGLPNFGVFVMLDAFHAELRAGAVPAIGKVRNTEKSRFQPPGPRNWFSRDVPKRTPSGCAHAAGSK